MWLCPVRSLSRNLSCYPNVLKGDVPLFEGKPQYTQYATWLKKIVKQLDTQLKRLAFEAGYLGPHSCCKVVAKMVAAGYTVYPLLLHYVFGRDGFYVGWKINIYSGRNLVISTSGAALADWINQEKNLQFPHHIFILQNYLKLRS